MENIVAKIALALATLTASIMTFFSGPAPEPQTPLPAPEIIVEETVPTTEPTANPEPPTPAPATDPVATAYEIGKQVGYIQAMTEVVQEEANKTPPAQVEPEEQLPPNEEAPMTEETNQPVEESRVRIDLYSEDKETGMGREYTAVTDPAIERWDQTSDYSNFVVINFTAYDEEGRKDSRADVKVTASDDSQSKQLGGKQEYQYLFKTPGEHTITFEYKGVSKSVTFNAK